MGIKRKLTAGQMIIFGLVALLLQRLPRLIFGYTIGMALGSALGLVGLASLVLGIISLIGILIRKMTKPRDEKKNQNILGIMPDSQELSKHFWHRLTKVLWLMSAIPLAFYLFWLVSGEFDFSLMDFVIILALTYFAVPLIYRVLLYIFAGSIRGERK